VTRPGAPVLVVEDDPDLLEIESAILRDAGYRVVEASDGLEALAAADLERPALVLLDMRMPRMNGWEFAREFRARHGPGCPIVVVTAAEDARARAREIGADAWLEKPFEVTDVLRLLARHLGDAGAPASH
jgi:DNA-binding response OmpR family regulator